MSPRGIAIKLHPWSQQHELVEYCQSQDIVLQAYSPLAEGLKMDDDVLGTIARKHGKSPAQVLLRYGLQKNWVVLPKSERSDRIEENMKVFDFELDSDDISVLDKLETADAV